jgi:predicted DNA-binding protein YlxM (UPF0122 family)
MKRLKQSIIEMLLKNDTHQKELAEAMGVKQTAIYQSLKNTLGRSIVKSYGGMHYLMDTLGLSFEQLVEELDGE